MNFSTTLLSCQHLSHPDPLAVLQFYGSPIQSVWRTRKPWEAMSRSSSALSPPRWRHTSLSSHGRKTLSHLSQVGFAWPVSRCAAQLPSRFNRWPWVSLSCLICGSRVIQQPAGRVSRNPAVAQLRFSAVNWWMLRNYFLAPAIRLAFMREL